MEPTKEHDQQHQQHRRDPNVPSESAHEKNKEETKKRDS